MERKENSYKEKESLNDSRERKEEINEEKEMERKEDSRERRMESRERRSNSNLQKDDDIHNYSHHSYSRSYHERRNEEPREYSNHSPRRSHHHYIPTSSRERPREKYSRDMYMRTEQRIRYHRKTSRENSSENKGNVIYVCNLPRKVDEGALKETFGQFGEIQKIEIIKEPYSSESRGFGFITYTDGKAANDAVEKMNKTQMEDKELIVELSKRTDPHKPTPGVYLGPKSERKYPNYGRFERRFNNRYERNDRYDRYNRYERNERYNRYERNDRYDRYNRYERNDRDRYERNYRYDRNERDRYEHNDDRYERREFHSKGGRERSRSFRSHSRRSYERYPSRNKSKERMHRSKSREMDYHGSRK
ncbi:MAG: hypothetical protein MJ252_12265 [archaeon]|nr:hypothetical protein [archaeon]